MRTAGLLRPTPLSQDEQKSEKEHKLQVKIKGWIFAAIFLVFITFKDN
jgi:hypothetical protein